MRVRMFLLTALAGGLVALSFAPAAFKQRLGTTGAFHFQGHLLLFALLSLAALSVSTGVRARCLALAVVLAGAFAIEWGQVLRFHIFLEWRDIQADALGIGFGATLFVLLHELRRS